MSCQVSATPLSSHSYDCQRNWTAMAEDDRHSARPE
jgi:hypothetical protein